MSGLRLALVASSSLSLALLSLPLSAVAQDGATLERARGHFEAGRRAFDAGAYEVAVTEFERAHELTGHPDLLFNIYSAAERAGQLERAVDALERFLEEGEIEPERRPVLFERLAHLRQRAAADFEAQANAAVLSEQAEAATEPSGVHPAGIGVLIGAGALALSFGALAVASEVEDSRLGAGCGASGSCTDDEVATLNALNIAADVSWIGAGVLAVAGVVLLLSLPPEATDSADVALAPWASPTAAGLVMRGRF